MFPQTLHSVLPKQSTEQTILCLMTSVANFGHVTYPLSLLHQHLLRRAEKSIVQLSRLSLPRSRNSMTGLKASEASSTAGNMVTICADLYSKIPCKSDRFHDDLIRFLRLRPVAESNSLPEVPNLVSCLCTLMRWAPRGYIDFE